ncbi:hypothetical protein AB4Z40_31470 [Bosea sp. 2YAB26]
MDCGNRPADRENEGAAQVEKSHKGFDGDHDGSACEKSYRIGTKAPNSLQMRLICDAIG